MIFVYITYNVTYVTWDSPNVTFFIGNRTFMLHSMFKVYKEEPYKLF